MDSSKHQILLCLAVIFGTILSETAKDPLCSDSFSNVKHIDSAAVINDTVFLFIDDLVYESTIDRKNIVIERIPEKITSKWDSDVNNNGIEIKDDSIIDSALCYTNAGIDYLVIYQGSDIFSINLNSGMIKSYPESEKYKMNRTHNDSKVIDSGNSTGYIFYTERNQSLLSSYHFYQNLLEVNKSRLYVSKAEDKIIILNIERQRTESIVSEGFIHNSYFYLFYKQFVYIFEDKKSEVNYTLKDINQFIICNIQTLEPKTTESETIKDKTTEFETKGPKGTDEEKLAVIAITVLIVVIISTMIGISLFIYICSTKTKKTLKLKSKTETETQDRDRNEEMESKSSTPDSSSVASKKSEIKETVSTGFGLKPNTQEMQTFGSELNDENNDSIVRPTELSFKKKPK